MPTTEAERLYEEDFYAWTRAQARALRRLARTRPNEPVDWKHLIEEVEALGRSELHAVRSHLRVLMEHLLKLLVSRAEEPRRGWQLTVLRCRLELADRLTPSLRRIVARELPRLYRQAREDAALALTLHGEEEAAARLPERCPWTLAELLDPDTLPERTDGGAH